VNLAVGNIRSNPEIKNVKDAMNKDTTTKVDGAVSLALL
jgi:hypothetical protein